MKGENGVDPDLGPGQVAPKIYKPPKGKLRFFLQKKWLIY